VSGFSEEDSEAVIDRLEAKYQAVAEGDAERLRFSRRAERDLEDIADCITQRNPGTEKSGHREIRAQGNPARTVSNLREMQGKLPSSARVSRIRAASP
jgi:plasmid stabilization system protein ParE